MIKHRSYEEIAQYFQQRDEAMAQQKAAEKAKRESDQSAMRKKWQNRPSEPDYDSAPKKARKPFIWQVRAQRYKDNNK